MKQIAIISLALVPLLTACTSSTLVPGLAPEAKQTRGVSSLHAQLRKLQRRVHVLNRRVKAQANRSPYTAVGAAGDLRDIKARLAQLEAAPRSDGAAASKPDLERTVADLAAQLAQLSRKVDAQGDQQPPASAAMERELSDLKARLAELEATPRPAESSASGSNLTRTVADLTARLAKLSRDVEAQANRPPRAPTAMTRDLGELKTRLAELDAARGSAASNASVTSLKRSVADLAAQVAQLSRTFGQRESSAASRDDVARRTIAESLAKLDVAQKENSNKFDKLQADLDKDRTLVIDYLDDLDKRIEALEKAKPTPAPAKP